MDALEQEYDDSVRRAALANRRHESAVWVVGLYVVAGGYFAAAAFLEGNVAESICVGVTTLVIAAILYVAVAIATWLVAYVRNRNVDASSTDRERGYRTAWPPRGATMDERRLVVSRYLRLVGPALVAAVYLGPVLVSGRFSSLLADDRLVVVGVLCGQLAMVVTKRVYAAWRKRRNARLELEWERQLESADTCEVRAREWTK